MDYQRRVYDLPAEMEDRLSAALWRSGALGCQIKSGREPGRALIEAWFPQAPPTPSFDLGSWPGVLALEQEDVADQDWLANYRARSQPFDVGENFRVDPRESLDQDPGSKILLHVPAENAFGTGSHESTRLMLHWLEELPLDGLRLLDVGTGSGILAFAAGYLGAAEILGYDFDAPSVITARRNIARNIGAVEEANIRFIAGTAASLMPQPRFDFLMINVLPERILPDIPHLVQTLVPMGRVISSGNLVTRRDELLARFTTCGLKLAGEKKDGEWLSFLFSKA